MDPIRETVETFDGTLAQVWHVPPPPDGAHYKVTEEKWVFNDEHDERHIYAYTLED